MSPLALHQHSPATRGWAGDSRAVHHLGHGALKAVGAGAGWLLLRAAVRTARRRKPRPMPTPKVAATALDPATETAEDARDLHAAAAALSASVLADSAIEHYRGSFENRAMFAPLIASTLALGVGTAAALAPRRARDTRGLRRGSYGLAAAVGLAGLGFHAYNVQRQPGGAGWQSLFYAAPLGAPAALVLGGAIGLAADRIHPVDHTARGGRIAGVPAGRALCALVSAGLLGTVAEVALLHYRGSFHNPVMWVPVALPPVAAAAAAHAAWAPARRPHPLARAWLRLTALLGMAGVGFHAYGVSRAMGGWRNWQQNLLDGPPLPAPPSFSALALAGLAALRLRERDDD